MQHHSSHQYPRKYPPLRVINPSLSTSPSYSNDPDEDEKNTEPFPSAGSAGRSYALNPKSTRKRPIGYTSSGGWLKDGDITDTPKRMISMAFPNPHADQHQWIMPEEDEANEYPGLASRETRKQTSISFQSQPQPPLHGRPAHYASPNSVMYDGLTQGKFSQRKADSSTVALAGTEALAIHLRGVPSRPGSRPPSRVPGPNRPAQPPMQVSMSDINHRRAFLAGDPYPTNNNDNDDRQSMRMSLSQPMSKSQSQSKVGNRAHDHGIFDSYMGLEPSTMRGYGYGYPMGRSTALSSFVNEYNPQNTTTPVSRTGTNQTRGGIPTTNGTRSRSRGRPALRLDVYGLSYVDEEVKTSFLGVPVRYNPHPSYNHSQSQTRSHLNENYQRYMQDGGTMMHALPSDNLTPWHPRPHRPPHRLHEDAYIHAYDHEHAYMPEHKCPHEHDQHQIITQEPKHHPSMTATPLFGIRNAKHLPSNTAGKREWSTDLCLFCDHNLGTCCKALWCPCIVYARNKARLEHLYIEESVHPSPGSTCSCSPDCVIHACLTTFCLFGWALQIPNRAAIRRRYNIEGDWVGDCAAACFCSACELAQESRELELEEGVLVNASTK